MKKSQKDLVYLVLRSVLAEKYNENKPMLSLFGFKKGKRNRTGYGVNRKLAEAIKMLSEQMKLGRITIPPKYQNQKMMYLRRIVYHWLNRDPRLNGRKNDKAVIERKFNTLSSKLIKKIAEDQDVVLLLEALKIKKESKKKSLQLIQLILEKAVEAEAE